MTSAVARDGTPELVMRALGPLDCRFDGQSLNLGGTKQQMVLALLLLEANRVVSVDRLLEWVWDDDAEPRNAATLQVYVSNWRRELAPAADRLGRPLIVTKRPGYELQLATHESDLLTFEALRREGDVAHRERRLDRALEAFRGALALWRDEPLAGLPIDPSATTGIRLERVGVMEQLAETELALGRHRAIVGELQAWLAEQPLNEVLRGHLMLALYRAGRQADALATYREGRELLVEELGIDPSRELRDLESRILRQDRSLDLHVSRIEAMDHAHSTQLRSSVLGPASVLEYPGGMIELDGPVLTIGRLADRDLVLDDAGVSRVHAEIRRVGGAHTITDQGSANGTVVNDRREASHVLADGDRIRLGSVELVYRVLDG